MGVMEEELENTMENELEMQNNEIDSIEAKKEVMLSRNISIHDCNEFINPSYTAHDFYNSSGTPISFSRRTRKRKLDVVMSSDSEDEGFNKQPSLVSDKNVNRELFIEENCGLLSHCPNMQNCIRPLKDELFYSEVEKYEDRGFQCCHMNFNKRSFSMGKFKNQVASDLVQESWKKLRYSHADLKHYVDSEPKDALKILKLTSRMSDLISQTDQLLSKCQMQDSLELLRILSENSDAFSWCDEQLQMANAVSQHGFCLYAKEIDAIGSNIGFEHRVDLSQEMLASSTSTMELGRLLGHDTRASRTSVDGKGLDMSTSKRELAVKRDVKSCLSNIISSIVPSRLYLALKGVAFHEYISSLGCISRSEASRLLVGMGLTKRRRTRGARHYLSTGALMLSPEDISFLGQYNFKGKLSSNS